jgi:hypothetical protein
MEVLVNKITPQNWTILLEENFFQSFEPVKAFKISMVKVSSISINTENFKNVMT